MKKNIYPYMGFGVYWHFFDKNPDRYEEYNQNRLVDKQALIDLSNLLSILAQHRLLFPTHILDGQPLTKIEIQGDTVQNSINNIVDIVAKNKIEAEIFQIAGYGYVLDEQNEFVLQEDLIVVDSFRFFQRTFSLSTNKSVWVPISLDDTYQFNWQIQLTRNNCPRLEASLREIKAALEIEMYPAEDEIDRDNPIWIKGYKPYINPSILLREYQKNPPSEPFDLQEFLIDEQSNKPKP